MAPDTPGQSLDNTRKKITAGAEKKITRFQTIADILILYNWQLFQLMFGVYLRHKVVVGDNELNKNSSFFVLWGNNYLLLEAGQPDFFVQ